MAFALKCLFRILAIKSVNKKGGGQAFFAEQTSAMFVCFGLLDFNEFHGFVEVVKDVHTFLGNLVSNMCSLLFQRDKVLLHHGVENLHQRLPRKVSSVHDAGRLVHSLPYGLQHVEVYFNP